MSRIDHTEGKDSNTLPWFLRKIYADLVYLTKQAIYLTSYVRGIELRRSLIDQGSLLNIIPLSTLLAMGVLRNRLEQPIVVLGFGGSAPFSLGYINLELNIKPMRLDFIPLMSRPLITCCSETLDL